MTDLNYEQLQQIYGDRYIAHRDGRVVAHAQSYDELCDELERRDARWDELVIEYVESADFVRVY